MCLNGVEVRGWHVQFIFRTNHTYIKVFRSDEIYRYHKFYQMYDLMLYANFIMVVKLINEVETRNARDV